MPLTIEERIFLVEFVFREGDKYSVCVQERFQERFPLTKLPHRDTVRDLVNKFRRTGSVKDEGRSGRPLKLDEDKLDEINNKIMQSPSKSMRKLAQETNLSVGSAHKATRKALGLFPYKVTAVQELQSTDFDKRLNYCHWMKNFVTNNGNEILNDTLFSDEAWFYLQGSVHSQNTRLWSNENPHEIQEIPLHCEKVGVWVAISRRRIVGPIFFNDTVNSERYCSVILQPFIAQLSDQERQIGYFQQDGATAHTANNTMRCLQNVFGRRLISKGLWPPRSPDLSPPDFYLWGAMKGSVYRNRPKTLGDLQKSIDDYVRSIPPNTLQRVFDNMMRRVDLCIEAKGQHFQHKL